MKKRYDVSLNEEKVDELKKWLDKRGLTFSGYLSLLIDEQVEAVKLFAPDGNLKKVTVSKFGKLAFNMVKKLNASIK